MNAPGDKPTGLPGPNQIGEAIEIFLRHAYGPKVPAVAERLIPPQEFMPRTWLMNDPVERMPPDAPFEAVRSFALRLGNSSYPHMKLRLSRPPDSRSYLFSVDCHDAFLNAPAGSPDSEALEQMKKHNAAVASAISAELNDAGLPTEHNYLRQRIRQARGGLQEAGE